MEKELLIIGSGPAGLRAGEEAKKAGIEYLILERGEIAQSWRDIRQDMIMLSPCLPQRDWTSISEEFPIWKMEVDKTTRFPFIKNTGESSFVDNLFFAGSLAYTRISSLLIHGFIRMVPNTIKVLSIRMVEEIV